MRGFGGWLIGCHRVLSGIADAMYSKPCPSLDPKKE